MGWNGRHLRAKAHTLYRPGEGRLASTSGKDFPKRAGCEFETEQAYPISIGGEHAYSWLRLLLPASWGEKSEAVGREVLSRAGILTETWRRRGAERNGETGGRKAWAKAVAERTSIPVT